MLLTEWGVEIHQILGRLWSTSKKTVELYFASGTYITCHISTVHFWLRWDNRHSSASCLIESNIFYGVRVFYLTRLERFHVSANLLSDLNRLLLLWRYKTTMYSHLFFTLFHPSRPGCLIVVDRSGFAKSQCKYNAKILTKNVVFWHNV